MLSSPLRSSSVPVKRSRVDTSPQVHVCALDKLRDITSDRDMPPYMKVVIDVLLDTKRELLDVIKRSDAILEENRKLREENFALKSQVEDLLASRGIHLSSSVRLLFLVFLKATRRIHMILLFMTLLARIRFCLF
ncbi:hypothetical protein V3C99_008724 [Haemonchus contortus]